MVLEALVYYLSTNAQFAAAVPGGLTPDVAEQGTPYPLTTYSVDGDTIDPLMDGTSGSMRRLLLGIDCYAVTRLETESVSAIIESVLLAVHGTIGDPAGTTAEIDIVRQSRPRFGLFETDTKLYCAKLQFDVAYYP